MTVYNRQIASAQRLIQKKGMAAIWIKNTNVPSNTQPWKVAAAAPQTFPVVIVRLPVGYNESEASKTLMTGTSVPTNHEMIFMAGNVPFTPAMNDSLDIGGEKKQIKSLNSIQPDGTPILYILTVL